MTNTITHDGVEYRKVNRKACTGELVEVFGRFPEADGIHKVERVLNDGHIFYGDYGRFYGGYFVLEPIESEEIPVEASPTVIALLANISRRLYEAEQTIKSQAYEINELYKAVAERG